MSSQYLQTILSRRSESAWMLIRFAAWWLIAFPLAVLLYAYDLRKGLLAMDAFKVFLAWGLLWLAYDQHKRANRAEARADALMQTLLGIKLDGVGNPPAGTAEVLIKQQPDQGTHATDKATRLTPAQMMGYLDANEHLLTHADIKLYLRQCTGDAFAPVRTRLLTLRQNLPSPTVEFDT